MYLTKRQKEVLDYVREQVERLGYAPTLHEMGCHFGLSSPATVYKHVEQLVKKGYLRKAPNQGRGIQLVDPEPIRTVEVPVLGQLATGRPIEALREAENVNVPPAYVGRRPSYALRVRGDSMTCEHIQDGDLVIVEERTSPEDGETVIALLGGDTVALRKYYRQGTSIRLQSANPVLEPQIIEDRDVRIHGIVIGVMRRY